MKMCSTFLVIRERKLKSQCDSTITNGILVNIRQLAFQSVKKVCMCVYHKLTNNKIYNIIYTLYCKFHIAN